jgi:hypothetical protein
MGLQAWIYVDDSDGVINAGSILPQQHYTEYKDTGNEQFSPENSTIARTYMVRWEERAAFLDDLLGYSRQNNTDILRVLPDEHPEYPLFFAQEAQVKGGGQLTNRGIGGQFAPLWNVGFINTVYKAFDFAVIADDLVTGEWERFTTKSAAPNTTFLSLNSAFVWRNTQFAGVPRVITSAPGIRLPSVELKYTWRQIPGVLPDRYAIPTIDNIQTCLGTLNNATFDGYLAGTLLFAAVNPKLMKPRLATNPVPYWDLEYTFILRNNGTDAVSGGAIGHNFLFDPRQQLWDMPIEPGSKQPMYTSSNFALLFEF